MSISKEEYLLKNKNVDIIIGEGVLMEKIEKGTIVNATVTGIESYGAFIVINNEYTGLIHISEISDDFIRNISDYLYIGEKIKIKVLDLDEVKKHIKASIKNINYRNQENNRINETEHGFETLKELLPVWIMEKINEFEKEKNKS